MCFTGPEHEGEPITEKMQIILDDQVAEGRDLQLKYNYQKK